MSDRPNMVAPTIDDDIDIEFTTTAAEPFLPGCETVIAICTKVEGPERFNVWGEPRTRLIFRFNVVEPNEHAGAELKMFCEIKKTWKYLPRSSKLRKIVEIAGGRLAIGVKIRFNALFRSKAFRCKLKHVIANRKVVLAAPYSLVETILEKVAG